jgi:hypothetical protein
VGCGLKEGNVGVKPMVQNPHGKCLSHVKMRWGFFPIGGFFTSSSLVGEETKETDIMKDKR